MLDLNEKRFPKGYIIRLYKRVANISEKEIIKNSMFMTWMNFDCMDINKVYSFCDFNNSIDLNKLEDREIYATRQKMFLYRIEANINDDDLETTDILSMNNKSLEDFPLLTLTMFDIQQNDHKFKDRLLEYFNLSLSEMSAVKGQVYGSLSLYDYVLVLRGNSYDKIEKILTRIKENINLDTDINLNKMYTIPAIDYTAARFWKDKDIHVSIRLSCASEITAQYLKNEPQLNQALDIDEIYSILGKYDYDIIGRIKSTEKFVDLFLRDGSLSAKKEKIHKSNTRFFIDESTQLNEEKKENENKSYLFGSTDSQHLHDEKNNELLKKFLTMYSEISGLSLSIQENLSRLIIRTFQVIISTTNVKIANDLERKLCVFLNFISIHQKKSQNNDLMMQNDVEVENAYAQMIDVFNLLLDNRVSTGTAEFETPQNVLRYSDSSMKVLLAYSTFVNYLVKILSYNKQRKAKESIEFYKLKYLTFVTVDPVARIRATVFLSYSKQYRIINIKVPVDLMFEIGNVLAWITHEVGHFIRAGWNRNERNYAYYKSVSRAVAGKLMPFADTQIRKNIELKKSIMENNKNLFFNTGEEERKFDDYQKRVKQYFQTIIYEFFKDYRHIVRVPYNKGYDLLRGIVDITEGLQRIYEESIADMFMLQVLDISELQDYLKIQMRYFERLYIDTENLPQENVSRIMAVSVVLSNISSSDYHNIKKYFNDLYYNNTDKYIQPILKKLKNYHRYYLLEPLVEFLDSSVKEGLMQLLKQKDISNIIEKLVNSYKKLKDGSFDDYLDFVLNFK